MKKLLLVLFTMLCLVTVHADILSNGDFSDGKSHWKGDLRAASEQQSNDVSSIDHPNTTPGVIIDLKPTWTQVSQIFNSHETAFTYKITYQLSDDFAVGGHNSPFPMQDRPNMPPHGPPNAGGPPNPFLTQLLNTPVTGDVRPPMGNEVLLLVVDMSNFTCQQVRIHLDPAVKGPQTTTGNLDEIGAHDDKTLYLIFPAGKGSVTLLNVSLAPVGEQKTSPADSPFGH
jgi:hypothetical protein